MPVRPDLCPVSDVAGNRLGVEVGRADGVLRELLSRHRTVAQLLGADAAGGKAERGVGRSPERYEQCKQRDGVVADEGEGLEHWTVSPYWVPGAPLPGPRVPFSPNAGRLLPELELLVVAPPLDAAGCEEAVVGVETA